MCNRYTYIFVCLVSEIGRGMRDERERERVESGDRQIIYVYMSNNSIYATDIHMYLYI